ncbi:hypothetical protein TELCIR_01115 [Teladorsagia circumcincta]|uniref:Uncharacterized protein n=1 Tax=Teladorsagia circumcincta TaxID=45464 RepID=A0A2G9V2V6_TELCI|nr:hypothetical protein TELCIR_01115 [Teladorsagia circumcincta]
MVISSSGLQLANGRDSGSIQNADIGGYASSQADGLPASDKTIMETNSRTPTLLNTSPLKMSQVSGFFTGLLVLVVIGYFTAALVNIWCFNVIMDCYRWLGFRLEEKSRALGRNDIPISRLDDKPPVAVVHATDF